MGSLPLAPFGNDSSYSLWVAVLAAQALGPSRLRFSQNSAAIASRAVSAWTMPRTFWRLFLSEESLPRASSSRLVPPAPGLGQPDHGDRCRSPDSFHLVRSQALLAFLIATFVSGMASGSFPARGPKHGAIPIAEKLRPPPWPQRGRMQQDE